MSRQFLGFATHAESIRPSKGSNMPDESQPHPGRTAPKRRPLRYLTLAVVALGVLAVVSALAPTVAWHAVLAWAEFGATRTQRRVDTLDFPIASLPEDGVTSRW